MYTKKLLFSVSACVAMLFAGCGKEDPAAPANNNPQNPPVTASLLCDGTTNTTHFFPLKMGNSWTSEGASGTTTKTINKDTVINGKKYFIISSTSAKGGEATESYFRSEPKGDIYEYKNYPGGSTYSKEYLFLPGDAEGSVGYEWDFPGATTATDGKMLRRKITSTNGSAKTSKCNYTGLIVINDYTSTGEVKATHYFKRGLGKVRESAGSQNSDLNAVVLKN